MKTKFYRVYKNCNVFTEETIWETENKQTLNDLIHSYGALYDEFYIKSDDKYFEIYKSSKNLGQFEIDYYNDDRLDFLDDNKNYLLAGIN